MKDGKMVNEGLRYSGMYVQIDNTISSNRNTGSGSFNIYDDKGNYVTVYPQSRYFRLDSHQMPGTVYDVPQDGTPIKSIRGILIIYGTTYEILPLYPGDVYITATPPIISTIRRDIVRVKPTDAVTISAHIQDLDGTVKSAALHYKVDSGNRVEVAMTKSSTDTTLYTATIPATSKDSAMVNFFITSKDNDGLEGYSPSDTVKGNYFYQTLNDPNVTIRDVEYSPYGSGYGAYTNYPVTLTGVITADSSDIPGFGSVSLRVNMQDGSNPWSGIQLGTAGTKGADILNLKRGDNVTISGTILENYSITTIDSITNITVNSSGNQLPAPVVVKTGTVDKATNGAVDAEQWESMLIEYDNISCTNENADGSVGPDGLNGNHNYGEIFISDGSGDTRVELQEGNHNYNNDWDSTLAQNPI